MFYCIFISFHFSSPFHHHFFHHHTEYQHNTDDDEVSIRSLFTNTILNSQVIKQSITLQHLFSKIILHTAFFYHLALNFQTTIYVFNPFIPLFSLFFFLSFFSILLTPSFQQNFPQKLKMRFSSTYMLHRSTVAIDNVANSSDKRGDGKTQDDKADDGESFVKVVMKWKGESCILALPPSHACATLVCG